MANATPTRLGQINNTGSDTALFLKVFGGEVLTAFREQNKFLPRHMVRSIPSGYTAQFPATWKASSSYHTPGAEILGQAIEQAERTIAIDDLLISDVFMARIDEAMNHYDLRSEFSYQLGAALARKFDTNVAQVGYLAARASGTTTSSSGGTALTDADANTNGNSLVASIFDAAQAMDEKDVPPEDRYAFVKPDQFYQLILSDKVVHTDYTASVNGGVDSGDLALVAGIQVVKTNNLPTTNITTGPAAYQGNFTTAVALVMHRTAVGTVKLLDLAVESEYDIRRQGTLMVAKYAVGHGVLRPEAAVEIKTA